MSHHGEVAGASKRPDRLITGLHFRGKLPHLKREGAVYFVTFRLADSLPAAEVARLKQERKAILEQARAGRRPLTWHEEQHLLAWYCEKVETLLDSGRGACWLSNPQVAALVVSALRHFDKCRCQLRAFVVMPNHVHALVQPSEGYTMSDILHSWKSYTASEANRILGRTRQAFWQGESFDHVVRDNEELVRLGDYIVANPVKAGLCRVAGDWPWSSATRGCSSGPSM